MSGPTSAAMVRAVPTPMAGMAVRPAPVIPRSACAVALSPAGKRLKYGVRSGPIHPFPV